MKFFIALLLFSTFAQAACMTTGECPRETVNGVHCPIVKTGTDPMGNVTCAKRCWSVPLAYVCKKDRHQAYGECVLEKEFNPAFDPNDPRACRRAIDL